MTEEEMVHASIIVLGQVQGVFFRASTLEQAQSLRVFGWVQNLPDGSVEIEAEGSRFGVETLIDWCKRGGPPDAKVDEVIVRWGTFKDEHRTFMIR